MPSSYASPRPSNWPPSSPLPVLIIGAGIAGLALAQVLLYHNIAFRIFERDNGIDERNPNHRIRITQEGTFVLKGCLSAKLYARLEACSAVNVAGKGLWIPWQLDAFTGEPRHGTALGRTCPSGEFPEIMGGKQYEEPLNVDRGIVRDVLMQGLESHVEFGKDFVRYDLTSNGFRLWKKRPSDWGRRTRGVKAFFRDGSQVQGSLLVGADGATSQLRKLLFPNLQHFIHRQDLVYGKTVITKELEEKLNLKCLEGPTIVIEKDRSVPFSFSLEIEPVRFKRDEFRGEIPQDYMSWVLVVAHEPQEEVGDSSPNSCTSEEELFVMVRDMTENWHHSFQALFDLADVRATMLVPEDLTPPRIPERRLAAALTGTTMIGDAALILPSRPCWYTLDLRTTNALHTAGRLSRLLIIAKTSAEDQIYDTEHGGYTASRFLACEEQIANSPRPFQSFEALFAEFTTLQWVAVMCYEDMSEAWAEELDWQWGYVRPEAKREPSRFPYLDAPDAH